MQNLPEDIANTVTATLVEAFNSVISFLPQFIAGLIILVIGWIIASILRNLTRRLFETLNIGDWFKKAGINKKQNQETWVNILSQLVFWTIIILFLIPVFETWNLGLVTNVIQQLLGYLPQVFASVIVGFFGFVLANLASDLVRGAARGYGANMVGILSGLARYSILVFTALIVLNQLGIAPQLIQIIVFGIMAAVALAIGLSFGLGGQDTARALLD